MKAPEYCPRCEEELDSRKSGNFSWCFTCSKWWLGIRKESPRASCLLFDDMGCYMEREV